MTKPLMPVEKLVEQIAQGCTDYADGDDPGHFKIEHDPATGVLTVSYAPDTDMDGTEFEAPFGVTSFSFVPAAPAASGLGWPEGGQR